MSLTNVQKLTINEQNLIRYHKNRDAYNAKAKLYFKTYYLKHKESINKRTREYMTAHRPIFLRKGLKTPDYVFDNKLIVDFD